MIIGIPKEIRDNENRVAATPESVEAFCKSGHRVIIEASAGAESGFSDGDYAQAGAEIAESKADLYACAEMILKAREPQPPEYGLLRKDQILFAFIVPVRSAELSKNLLDRGVLTIAYECVRTDDGSAPILASMSRIAGSAFYAK